MKIITIAFILTISSSLQAQINFDKYFIDKSLRFDYNIGGNNKETKIFYNKIKQEPFWGGSTKKLIDNFNFGDFRIKISDKKTNKLIYSRGYSSLYYEWVDTDEAKNTSRSFYESVTCPFPKNTVILKIEMRNKNLVFETLFETEINPNDISIIKDKQSKYKTNKMYYSGDYHKKLDIVIIPDGYTKEEMSKFNKDCQRFIDYFFEVEPFKSHNDKVNFWAVNAISEK